TVDGVTTAELISGHSCRTSQLAPAQSDCQQTDPVPRWAWAEESRARTPRAAGCEPLEWEEILEEGHQRMPTQESIRVAARFRPLSLLE
ncbi:kin, partial [Symbiodinium pilosum]